jgi:hypothetical protein
MMWISRCASARLPNPTLTGAGLVKSELSSSFRGQATSRDAGHIWLFGSSVEEAEYLTSITTLEWARMHHALGAREGYEPGRCLESEPPKEQLQEDDE